MGKATPLAQRIMEGSMPEPNSGCWIWLRKCFPSEEGAMRGAMNILGKTYAAYRVSYEAFVGPIPDGVMILHSCDNDLCVNPDHLRPGTHAENMEDMRRRNRHRTSRLPYSRLKDNQREQIRALRSTHTVSELARRFGVTRSAIRYIAS